MTCEYALFLIIHLIKSIKTRFIKYNILIYNLAYLTSKIGRSKIKTNI